MGLKTHTLTSPATNEWVDWVDLPGAQALVDINILNRGFESARMMLALADKSRNMLTSPAGVEAQKIGDHGHGRRAAALIGSGTDGTVDVRVAQPGLEGNEYTVEVITTQISNQPLTANLIGEEDKDLRIILATDSEGALDDDANKASLVAAIIETLEKNEEPVFVAEASGTGEAPLTGEEEQKLFQGGVAGKDYSYKVSALDASGETLASEAVLVEDCHPEMNEDYYVSLAWEEVPGAVSYKVYGRIEHAEIALAEVAEPAYTDKMLHYLGENPSWVNTTGLKARLWEGELNARFLLEITGRKFLLDGATKLIVQVSQPGVDFTAFGAEA